MTDMTSNLAALGVVSAIVAAFLGGVQKYTTLPGRSALIIVTVLGPAVGVLLHYSGWLELAKEEPRNTILAAAWGLIAAVAGAGLTDHNVLDLFRKGKTP